MSTKAFIARKISQEPGFFKRIIIEKDKKIIKEIRNENSGAILNFFISARFSIWLSRSFRKTTVTT